MHLDVSLPVAREPLRPGFRIELRCPVACSEEQQQHEHQHELLSSCVQIFGLAPEALPHDVERLPLEPAQGGSDVSRRFNALLECVPGRCYIYLVT